MQWLFSESLNPSSSAPDALFSTYWERMLKDALGAYARALQSLLFHAQQEEAYRDEETQKQLRLGQARPTFPPALRDNGYVRALSAGQFFVPDENWQLCCREVFYSDILPLAAYRKGDMASGGWQGLRHLVMKVFFKNEKMVDFCQKRYLYWTTQKVLVKALLEAHEKIIKNEPTFLFTFDNLSLKLQGFASAHDFACQLFSRVVSESEALEGTVGKLSAHWDWKRMQLTDRTLLKMALTEFSHHRETPTAAIMDEYIELAKQYGSAQSSGFVNGLLEAALPLFPDRVSAS